MKSKKLKQSEIAQLQAMCKMLPDIPVLTSEGKQLTKMETRNGAYFLTFYPHMTDKDGKKVKKGKQYSVDMPQFHKPFPYFMDIIANRKVTPDEMANEVKRWQERHKEAVRTLLLPKLLTETNIEDEKTRISNTMPADDFIDRRRTNKKISPETENPGS